MSKFGTTTIEIKRNLEKQQKNCHEAFLRVTN